MAYLGINSMDPTEKQVAKLQQQLVDIEQQMAEQSVLRSRLEQLGEQEALRTERAVERARSSTMRLQEEIDRRYEYDDDFRADPSANNLLYEVMTLRTKEFEKSQAKKAANIQNLTLERQRIMDARNRLREKKDVFRSIPSPIGKATHKYWGHKYSIYTPLSSCHRDMFYRPSWLDRRPQISYPVWDAGCYTYFPRARRKYASKSYQDVLYVPTPLHYDVLWR